MDYLLVDDLLVDHLPVDDLHVDEGPFKCYVTPWGVGGCQLSRKKALRRCTVQRY